MESVYSYSQQSQIIDDTVEPSLPAQEINLKACDPEIQTLNLSADWKIKPWFLQWTIPEWVYSYNPAARNTRQSGSWRVK